MKTLDHKFFLRVPHDVLKQRRHERHGYHTAGRSSCPRSLRTRRYGILTLLLSLRVRANLRLNTALPPSAETVLATTHLPHARSAIRSRGKPMARSAALLGADCMAGVRGCTRADAGRRRHRAREAERDGAGAATVRGLGPEYERNGRPRLQRSRGWGMRGLIECRMSSTSGTCSLDHRANTTWGHASVLAKERDSINSETADWTDPAAGASWRGYPAPGMEFTWSRPVLRNGHRRAASVSLHPSHILSTSSPTSTTTMAQVIVVGGGLAGLSAAHTLLERGANVLMLDKQP